MKLALDLVPDAAVLLDGELLFQNRRSICRAGETEANDGVQAHVRIIVGEKQSQLGR